MKIILGISAYYHDSAATLIVDGKIVAAAQEERFSRIKNTSEFPEKAIQFCLREAGFGLDDVDAIVFYDKPFLKMERILENFYAMAPRGFFAFIKFMPEWSQKKIFLKSVLKKALKKADPNAKKPVNLYFSSHHLSHAASAFYPSPFQEAAILSVDAVGEWATASIAKGSGTEVKLLKEMHFPDSVGLLYSSFTYFLGFKVNNGEYKLMGLTPYGNEESGRTQNFIKTIKAELVEIFEDGSIRLNQSYFKYRFGLKMIRSKKWEKLFGCEKRTPKKELLQVHADLALAIQLVTEEIILKMAKTAKVIAGANNLCLAGGVALNSVINGKLIESGLFNQIWVQPAAGDAGGSLGAALAFYYTQNPEIKRSLDAPNDGMRGAFLGPSIRNEEIEDLINEKKLDPEIFKDDANLVAFIAGELANEKVVAWVKGRMEFGPRALGGRSILAAPFKGEMQRKLNQAVKFREDFRPFAPVMLKEEAEHYFGFEAKAAYMQFVKKLKPAFRLGRSANYDGLNFVEKLAEPRSKFQAVTHVDFSARLQIVDHENHPLFKLLNSFKKITGSGILINTSFNTNEEPIVCTANDAYAAFMKSDIDILVIENYVFTKSIKNVGSN